LYVVLLKQTPSTFIFLYQILDQSHWHLYSFINELPVNLNRSRKMDRVFGRNS